MRCSCIKGDFDFSLEESSCGAIYYVDRSTWMTGPDYDPVRSYELNITHPSGNTTTHTVVVGIPLLLDLGNCPTPEVYTFSVESCTDEFTKDYPILCTLNCGYLKAAAKLGSAGVNSTVLRDISEGLDRIRELVSYGAIEAAKGLLTNITSKLKSINCDCSCF